MRYPHHNDDLNETLNPLLPEPSAPIMAPMSGSSKLVAEAPKKRQFSSRSMCTSCLGGALFMVLLEARGGDPADTEAGIGDWLWDEIWTDDPDGTEAFYEAVLGYDEVALGEGYDIFLYEGEWRAGIRYVKDNREHMLWVPVVRVADPAVTVQAVPELGGVVWVAPDEPPSDGNTALIGDSTGALLLIQRWPPLESPLTTTGAK